MLKSWELKQVHKYIRPWMYVYICSKYINAGLSTVTLIYLYVYYIIQLALIYRPIYNMKFCCQFTKSLKHKYCCTHERRWRLLGSHQTLIFIIESVSWRPDRCKAPYNIWHHCLREVSQFLDDNLPGLWVGRAVLDPWPTRSPDFNPLEYFFWGYVKDHVYILPLSTTVNKLKEHVS